MHEGVGTSSRFLPGKLVAAERCRSTQLARLQSYSPILNVFPLALAMLTAILIVIQLYETLLLTGRDTLSVQ